MCGFSGGLNETLLWDVLSLHIFVTELQALKAEHIQTNLNEYIRCVFYKSLCYAKLGRSLL